MSALHEYMSVVSKADLMEECPEHAGAFDCTPFCPVCEGAQEYDRKQLREEG